MRGPSGAAACASLRWANQFLKVVHIRARASVIFWLWFTGCKIHNGTPRDDPLGLSAQQMVQIRQVVTCVVSRILSRLVLTDQRPQIIYVRPRRMSHVLV